MPTRILDLDLAAPLPDSVALDGHDRVWLIGWRAGVPVGTALLVPEPGADLITGHQIRSAIVSWPDTVANPATSPIGQVPTLSVVVCTRNRPDRLPIALEAIEAQTLPEIELIVVDNAPRDDRTRRVTLDRASGARYLVEPVPGLPRARNAGLRVASGDVVAFTDDDCRPVPGWAEAIVRRFAETPEIGCVTGPILPLELETPAQEAMERRGGFNRGFSPVIYTPDSADGPVYPVQAWKFGAGGNMALSRECLIGLGGFDEALWRSEDLDIFYRTLRAGYALAFEPAAVVLHRHLPDWSQLGRRLFHWGWGYNAFLDKIARSDTPDYSSRAREERRNWLHYQFNSRALPALRRKADLPLFLVLMEIAGGVIGRKAYPLARVMAERRVARTLARSAR